MLGGLKRSRAHAGCIPAWHRMAVAMVQGASRGAVDGGGSAETVGAAVRAAVAASDIGSCATSDIGSPVPVESRDGGRRGDDEHQRLIPQLETEIHGASGFRVQGLGFRV